MRSSCLVQLVQLIVASAPFVWSFVITKPNGLHRTSYQTSLRAIPRQVSPSISSSSRKTLGSTNYVSFSQGWEQTFGVLLHGSIDRKLTVLAHPLSIVLVYLIVTSKVGRAFGKWMVQLLQDFIRSVQSLIQRKKQKPDLATTLLNKSNEIKRLAKEKSDRLKVEEDRLAVVEDRRKQVARKDASDTIAMAGIKVRLSSLKDTKGKNQLAGDGSIYGNVALDIDDKTTVPRGSTKEGSNASGQTSKLVQIARRQEEMVKTGADADADAASKNRSH